MMLWLHHTTNYSWSGTFLPIHLQAGLLTHRSSHEIAFPIAQWHFHPAFPKYSDEFAQDLHLFPFSPDTEISAPTPAVIHALQSYMDFTLIYHIPP